LFVAVIILLTDPGHRLFNTASSGHDSVLERSDGHLIFLKFSFARPVKYRKRTGERWYAGRDHSPLKRTRPAYAKARRPGAPECRCPDCRFGSGRDGGDYRVGNRHRGSPQL